MEWWEALVMGIVQGLTEFLPVSSSGHLMISKALLGVDSEGFLDFTVTVHFATVLSTIVVFWGAIWKILKGVFKFRYNDETDYFLKICVSMIPVAVVGFCFKDKVEAMFGDTLRTVAVFLLVTAVLLCFSDVFTREVKIKNNYRNGISWWQAIAVGLGQACAVAPGLSRSGTTIATGLICGVKRDQMAQFSFLMVLIPIVGEQMLTIIDMISGEVATASGVGFLSLLVGFLAAFLSGLFACKVMIALVSRARLSCFALYCVLAAVLIFVFA
jgi:undecaprenyl-diphosphatase